MAASSLALKKESQASISLAFDQIETIHHKLFRNDHSLDGEGGGGAKGVFLMGREKERERERWREMERGREREREGERERERERFLPEKAFVPRTGICGM